MVVEDRNIHELNTYRRKKIFTPVVGVYKFTSV